MLAMDEVEVGKYVTILQWHPMEPPAIVKVMAKGAPTEFIPKTWVGMVMEVVAVSAPFVIVDVTANGEVVRQTLDTRECDLQSLPEEFAQAALAARK
jgi:hypothetical protein